MKINNAIIIVSEPIGVHDLDGSGGNRIWHRSALPPKLLADLEEFVGPPMKEQKE